MSDIPEYAGYHAYHGTSRNPRVQELRNRNQYYVNAPENRITSFLENAILGQIDAEENLRAAVINNAAYFGGMRAHQDSLIRHAAHEAALVANAIRENHRLRNDSQTREAAARRAITMGLAGNDQLFLSNQIGQNWSPELTQEFMSYLPSGFF